jgi:hypothetical protein
LRFLATALALACVSGCTSVVNTGAGEIAGIAGAAVAGAVTSNAGVAAGIGLGARAGVQHAQRRVHRAAQIRIAAAAGPLGVGEVAPWETAHEPPFEDSEQGRVTVSRVISMTSLECKEIVFSVDSVVADAARSAFYVAMVCRDGATWKWASAEPATERWGGLQ